MIKINMQEIEEGIKLYSEYLTGRTGHFYSCLCEAVGCADRTNIYKLAEAFPGIVWGYLSYQEDLKRISWQVEGETLEQRLEREHPHLKEALKRNFQHE